MLEIAVDEISGSPVVTLRGDVDLSNSTDVCHALLEVSGRGQITVVDMSGVASIDSSGIASLLEGHQLARKRGNDFVLAACSDGVNRILGLAKLDNVFHLADSVEAALEGIA